MEHKNSRNILAQRIRELIKSANNVQGKTIDDLAGEMGINSVTLDAYRVGKYQPGAEHLLILADYFGVSADYLLGREGYYLEVKK